MSENTENVLDYAGQTPCPVFPSLSLAALAFGFVIGLSLGSITFQPLIYFLIEPSMSMTVDASIDAFGITLRQYIATNACGGMLICLCSVLLVRRGGWRDRSAMFAILVVIYCATGIGAAWILRLPPPGTFAISGGVKLETLHVLWPPLAACLSVLAFVLMAIAMQRR